MSHDASGGMQVWWSEHWYLFPLLNAAERSIVSTLAQRFCERTTFLFSPGIERREELTWLVAGYVGVMGAAQRVDGFESIRWVYFLDDGIFEDDRSGDAYGATTLRLNAHDVWEESLQCCPGQQIVVHELAHALDHLLGVSDSTPGLREGLAQHLDNRRLGIDDGIPDDVVRVMIEEDSTVEFFAYVSEWFFTDPEGLCAFHAGVYLDLVGLYGIDFIGRHDPAMLR